MLTKAESLALAISELIKRMSPAERIELTRHISWQEIEEWKATEETLSDSQLMANLKQGLKEEKESKVERVEF
jgi:hypothetical protein